jgi:hypothetical protein
VCIEEAGLYSSPAALWWLFAVLRSAHGVPTQMIVTGNPGGPVQHNKGVLRAAPVPAAASRAQAYPTKRGRGPGGDHSVAAEDNRIPMETDLNYVNNLYKSGSAQFAKAWLDGDWTAIAGRINKKADRG